ncbi:DUF3304 domain-containing protein [Alcaligenaceae bacterium]|nr:DUF3304 domain-containing protein [Alcaligenaceae bacterium]
MAVKRRTENNCCVSLPARWQRGLETTITRPKLSFQKIRAKSPYGRHGKNWRQCYAYVFKALDFAYCPGDHRLVVRGCWANSCSRNHKTEICQPVSNGPSFGGSGREVYS